MSVKVEETARLTDLLASDRAVREMEGRCRSFVRRFVGVGRLWPAEEDDAVQDALMAAVRQAQKIERGEAAEVKNVDGWLFRVSTNAVRRMWRGSAHFKPLDECFELPAPPALSAEERLTLRRALDRLDPESRQLLLLRDVGGEDRRVMAEALGITVNALGVRLHRCRRRLLALYLAFAC